METGDALLPQSVFTVSKYGEDPCPCQRDLTSRPRDLTPPPAGRYPPAQNR
jgi:hypothetical protein